MSTKHLKRIAGFYTLVCLFISFYHRKLHQSQKSQFRFQQQARRETNNLQLSIPRVIQLYDFDLGFAGHR